MLVNQSATESIIKSIVVTLLFVCVFTCEAASGKKDLPSPPVKVLVADNTADAAVLTALKRDGYHFTANVRSAFLMQRKAQALNELKAHGISLPADFLRWVDASPVVASSVYGVRWGTPAQVLVVLRSLELDLGPAKLRKHPQLALATAMLNSAAVNLSDPEAAGFSLKGRRPLKLKIPPSPVVKVNTHPTDRPMDVNDHIINFFEEEEVVALDSKGKAIVSVRPRANPIRACDVVADRALQIEFNAYMKRKGQDVKPLDCGDQELHWNFGGVSWRLPHSGDQSRAWKLFYTAYTAKGRLPNKRDPYPTPTEWLAYQINNAETRNATLPDAWPIAMYLMQNPQPLRESEYVWDEKARGLNPMRYVEYVGKIAQDPCKLKLRRLIPFDFGYGSYPMQRKDGGVCGTHTGLSMRAGAALGRCIINCSSPGHSYPGSISKIATGYKFRGGCAGVKWYFGASTPEGTGGDIKLHAICWAMNFGLQAFVDSQLGWTLEMALPKELRVAHGPTLLSSALARNPYNLSLARIVPEATNTQAGLANLWTEYRAAIESAADKPGCPQRGGLYEETWGRVLAGLKALPPPPEKALCTKIYTLLLQDDCSSQPEVLVKYRRLEKGAGAVLAAAEKALSEHIGTKRTPSSCSSVASLITAAAVVIDSPEQRKSWAQSQVRAMSGLEMYLHINGRAVQVETDPCATTLYTIAGIPQNQTQWLEGLMDQMTEMLKAHLASRRSTESCKTMAHHLNVATQAAKDARINLAPWAETWLEMMEGNQRYGPHYWTAKDHASTVIDRLYNAQAVEAILPPEGIKTNEPLLSEREWIEAEIDRLNNDNAKGENQNRINELNLKLDALDSAQDLIPSTTMIPGWQR